MGQGRNARRHNGATSSPIAPLWAPWRSTYLRAARARPRACIFCLGRLSERTCRRRLVLYAGPVALVMLNRYPYNNGHILIAPRRHLASPELLSSEERRVIGEIIAQAVPRIRRALKPQGFNLGANLGRTAGAGFADHVHWHVVPRWDGDTNFMPVIGSTRLLSQHLAESFALLDPLFKTIGASVS
jgi:ATP adenylyltransferase